MNKTFPKIFDKAGKINIGQKFSEALLEHFLNIGITMAIFRLVGKIPNLDDVSMKYVKLGKITGAVSLTK